MDLTDAVKFAVKRAIELGASQADCYGTKDIILDIRAVDRRDGFKKRESKRTVTAGMNLRVVLDKSIAYGFVTSLNRGEIERIVDRTLKTARAMEEDLSLIHI